MGVALPVILVFILAFLCMLCGVLQSCGALDYENPRPAAIVHNQAH
jgi:hypothetical protein